MEQLNEHTAPEKKVFRFRFSALLLTVMCVGLALCAACIALTTWQLIDFLSVDGKNLYDWIKFSLMYFVAALLAVLLLAMLIKSQYVFTEKELVLQFGIVKSKYEIAKIYSAKLFKKSYRLVVYFDDFQTKFMNIVVREEWYEEFIKELGMRNEKILFDCVSEEEEKQYKNDKKKK